MIGTNKVEHSKAAAWHAPAAETLWVGLHQRCGLRVHGHIGMLADADTIASASSKLRNIVSVTGVQAPKAEL